MGVLSNKIHWQQLKPGDHIYSWRQAYIYAHHGIYIGDGMVIHFTRKSDEETSTGTILNRLLLTSTPPNSNLNIKCPTCGNSNNNHTKPHGVISSCLNCFLSGGHLYLFQYGVTPPFFLAKARGGTCTLAHSDPTHHVLHRAFFLLENGFGNSNVFNNNCEDFAIYCKTGLLVFTGIGFGRSGQAASYLAAAGAAVSSPIKLLTAAGFGGLALVGCGLYCASRLASDIGVRQDVVKVPVERLVVDSSPEKISPSLMASHDKS